MHFPLSTFFTTVVHYPVLIVSLTREFIDGVIVRVDSGFSPKCVGQVTESPGVALRSAAAQAGVSLLTGSEE